MELIPLTHGHIPAATALFARVFTQEPWNETFDSPEPVMRYFENMLRLNSFWGCALMDGENLIALCAGLVKPCLQGLEYFCDLFCLDPACQGRGLGTEFLTALGLALQKEGVSRLYLTTPRDLPARDFYLKNGFYDHQNLSLLTLDL
ncbi:MAG: GNAT family N-acetyltransferase [Clostridia bacterium]|nr:GNAT family N-acetyltransferase [Clostridia bacterium]